MEDFKYKTKIISAFPGTGKSYFVDSEAYRGSFSSSDSDSSKFSKHNFPDNYIEHIKSLIGQKYAVFVSSHKDVRNSLVSNGIEFMLIYPAIILKDEYIERYKKRGSSDAFIKLISDNWDMWILDCHNQQNCQHVVLRSKQYISHII